MNTAAILVAFAAGIAVGSIVAVFVYDLTRYRPVLVRSGDIARMLGVVPSAVANWQRRRSSGFPAPVVTVSAEGTRPLHLWDWRVVEAWANERKATDE